MSLTECHECKAKISDEAKACPQCGAPVKQPPGRLKILFVGLILFAVVKTVWDSNNAPAAPQKTPEEIAAAERKEAQFQSVLKRVQSLKASTKNPASFDLVDAVLVDGDVVCAIYRGTNSFNAVITEQKSIHATYAVGVWNHDCKGKTGTNYAYIKESL